MFRIYYSLDIYVAEQVYQNDDGPCLKRKAPTLYFPLLDIPHSIRYISVKDTLSQRVSMGGLVQPTFTSLV